ncbi:MAG TPA: FixH family protein [Sphingomonadaceae bacterium]|nr:FixH family protein [Sphingomonadaceae bacterium]
MAQRRGQGGFTGWHATGILVVFFGIIVTVNVSMAMLARSNFSGAVVENSYVASQEFNSWLAQAEQARSLGWSPRVSRRDDGRLSVGLAGAPAGIALKGTARHPLGRSDDLLLEFRVQDDGSFRSREALPEGRWILRLEAMHGGILWRAEEHLR